MTEFNHFSPCALTFLSDLKSNNTKDWFAANKATYERHLKRPGRQFADAMTLALHRRGVPVRNGDVGRVPRRDGGNSGAELIGLTAKLRASGIRVAEPELKRLPSGFDKNHPHGEALRRKGFTAWIDHTDPSLVVEADLNGRLTAQFNRLLPVFRLLSEVK